MTERELTPLGQLLEAARERQPGLTGRKAAVRAGISEGRWRQVVSGQQKAGGGRLIPANPRVETVIAMALAVDVDPAEALAAANLVSPTPLDQLVAAVRARLSGKSPRAVTGKATADLGGLDVATRERVAAEIERVGASDLPAAMRLQAIRALLDIAEEMAAEQQHAESQSPRRAAS